MPHEERNVELHELAPDEICELAGEAGIELSLEQARELAELAQAAGGIEAAIVALDQLDRRRGAA